MIEIALTFAFGCFGLALVLALWRLVAGPEIADRVLALDTLFINVIGMIVLYGIAGGVHLFEAAMIIAMLGFVSTVAYARFMLRSNIIE